MEGVIGYTTLFAGNFAPKNWALCQGQLVSIAQNTALFSILGVTYGGDGRVTFGLPDLQGRAVVGAGQLAGGSQYTIGEQSGTQKTAIGQQEMGAHVHPVQMTITPVAATNSSTSSPVNGVYANTTEQLYNSSADSSLKSYPVTLTMQNAGGGVPFANQQPVLCLNYVICLYGVYPQRS